ncbi:MAG: arsenate reductase (glutaredoxin) [Flavobacteriaceae bacterium]|jgi:arsenate reductase|nr:arsenate reductase (glutaredoxin) [Flavobacteriaceae bacterium]
MIKIYHNPRCRKSREALKYIEDKGASFEVIQYLQNPLTGQELSNLINKLNISPIDLIRKEEALWKTQFKDKNLDNKALINLMIKEPRLMQRPIIEFQDMAVIARPIIALENLI